MERIKATFAENLVMGSDHLLEERTERRILSGARSGGEIHLLYHSRRLPGYRSQARRDKVELLLSVTLPQSGML